MKAKLLRGLLVLTTVFIIGSCKQAQTPAEDAMALFVDSLLGRMTLEEKAGQLYVPDIVVDSTGPVLSSDMENKIKKGLVGGVYNVYTPASVKRMQDLAL